MKKWNVILMIFAATFVLAPVVQATNMVLDPMTQGNILDPGPYPGSGPPRWHDDRFYNPPLLKDSAFSHDGDGSMMIDYTVFDGSQYDVVPRGYFGWGASVPPEHPYPPVIPALSLSDSFTFWWYKPAATGPLVINDGMATGPSPEHVRQIQIYSNTSNPNPDAQATFDVATGEEEIEAGWHYVVAPLSQFNNIGAIDLSNIDLIDFWVSCWGYVGPWGEEGSYQIMPTNQPVYIDDLQIIPEPATMSLLALGALAMLKRRRA